MGDRLRLNTDNPQTQPITDSVYGKPPKRPKPKSGPVRQRPAERPLWRLLPELALLKETM